LPKEEPAHQQIWYCFISERGKI